MDYHREGYSTERDRQTGRNKERQGWGRDDDDTLICKD